MNYQPGLNEQTPFEERMSAALEGARRLHVATAYAKTSGSTRLLGLDPPRGSRAVIGLGFGITDPLAVEQLDSSGFDVRVVADGAIAASQFHPKLYVVERRGELRTLSASANLTASGWNANVEQFEELSFSDPSDEADRQRERFELVWAHGSSLNDYRRSGEWDRYRQRARDRRHLERADQRRLTRLHASTGQLLGVLARSETVANPGYIGVTNDDWWALQLQLRDQTDRALFWRRNTKAFKALARGGVFFHLVKDPDVPEDQRAVRGYSIYPGNHRDYEVGDARLLYRRYGRLLGVVDEAELFARLSLSHGASIGIIHLESLTEFERPVTLDELRANGVSFAQNIVSGRSLNLTEVAILFELGGLGVEEGTVRAAESPGTPWLD